MTTLRKRQRDKLDRCEMNRPTPLGDRTGCVDSTKYWKIPPLENCHDCGRSCIYSSLRHRPLRLLQTRWIMSFIILCHAIATPSVFAKQQNRLETRQRLTNIQNQRRRQQQDINNNSTATTLSLSNVSFAPSNSPAPSYIPTRSPQPTSTPYPTKTPSFPPSPAPTATASNNPTSSVRPSSVPSSSQQPSRSFAPTNSSQPSQLPSMSPSMLPSTNPTKSLYPSASPSEVPSNVPTSSPRPSTVPSEKPSPVPSAHPSASPSNTPLERINRNNVQMVLEGIPGNGFIDEQDKQEIWQRVTAEHVETYYNNLGARLERIFPVKLSEVKIDPPTISTVPLRNVSLSAASSGSIPVSSDGQKFTYIHEFFFRRPDNEDFNIEDFDKDALYLDPFRKDSLRYVIELMKAWNTTNHIWLDHIEVGEQNRPQQPPKERGLNLGRNGLIGLTLGVILMAVLVVVFIMHDSYKMEQRFRMAHLHATSNNDTTSEGDENAAGGAPAAGSTAVGVDEGDEAGVEVGINTEMASASVPLPNFPPPGSRGSSGSSYGGKIPAIPIQEESPENGGNGVVTNHQRSRSGGSGGRPPLGPSPPIGKSPLAITLEEDLEVREDVNRRSNRTRRRSKQRLSSKSPPPAPVPEGPGPLDMTLIPLEDNIIDTSLSASPARPRSTSPRAGSQNVVTPPRMVSSLSCLCHCPTVDKSLDASVEIDFEIETYQCPLSYQNLAIALLASERGAKR